MEPPPPLVSALTSLMCICLSVWTYASNGRSTAALAVSSFALLSLQLLTVNKLRFSQLASSVFGLFYCGKAVYTLNAELHVLLQLQTYLQVPWMTLIKTDLVLAGYLPSFWIKLRVLSAPAINSTALHAWPVYLGTDNQLYIDIIPIPCMSCRRPIDNC